MNSQIIPVVYEQEIDQIHRIRRLVYQEEQGIDPNLEFDGKDTEAQHLLAFTRGEAIGTARIRFIDQQTGKIERLAVLKSWRGQGIGTQLMQKALEVVQQRACHQAVIHAQVYIEELHKKVGFQSVGGTFLEAGIPHVKMVKKLR